MRLPGHLLFEGPSQSTDDNDFTSGNVLPVTFASADSFGEPTAILLS
jgi:hypothetical protein